MIKVFVKGPILTQTGYGHHARTVIRALRTRPEVFDLYIHPLTWGQTSWLWEDNEERAWFDETLKKTIAYSQNNGTFDISLQVTIPNEWEKIAPINIGVTAGIETTKVAPQWIEKSFLMDKIITISNHSKQTYKNTSYDYRNEKTGETGTIKLETPIEHISYPVRSWPSKKLDLELTTGFNFLSVAQLSPRKNTEQTIKSFIEQFSDNEDAGLIIKANIAKNSLIDRLNTQARFKEIVAKYPDRKCKIYLLHGYLTEEQMAGLYTHPKIKALISTTHGEGFGLPLFEAAHYGLPVIATDWSGHLDFLYKPVKQKNGKTKNKHMFSRISYTLQPVQEQAVWDGVIQKDSMWAFPEEGSIKMAMDEMYKDHGRFKKRAKELQKWVCDEFNEEKIYDKYIKSLEPYIDDVGQKIEDVDYVFVSDFFSDQIPGGAEYSLEALYDVCPGNFVKFNTNKLNEEIIKLYGDKKWIFGNYSQINKDIINLLLYNEVDYNVIEFDYKFCKYRNLELHKLLENENCQCGEQAHGHTIEKFLSASQNIFFMSEKQLEIHLDNLKNIDKEKCSVLSSVFKQETLDKISDLRKKYKNNKNNKWVISASPNWVKGAENAKKWCEDNNVDTVELNDMPYDKALESLASSTGLYFHPPGADTCPRLVIEAKLLGCELNLNEHVQHLDEEWFKKPTASVEKYLRKVPSKFWKKIKS